MVLGTGRSLGAGFVLTLTATALCLAGVASAAKLGGRAPFSLPDGARPIAPLWNGPPTTRIAVAVRTNAGTVRVHAPADVPIGTVPAGATAVWEGAWPSVTLVGMAADTSTGWTTVAEDSGADPQRLLGAGSLTLPLPSGGRAFTCYKGDAARCRMMLLKASGEQVTVSSGIHTLAVDPGDVGCFVRTTTSFALSGGGTTSFELYDLDPAGTPTWSVSGTASAQGEEDGDALHFDGTARVRVTLWNRSPTGQVVITCVPACAPSATLEPGGSAAAFGAVSEFRWTYQGGATQVAFTIESE